jgi:4-hydroxy-tetrahydrodipicolinate synthase
MQKIPFGRLLTAMVTPFKENLEVDYEQAAKLACKLIQDGNDGIVVAGTTGESPTLTHEEKFKLFKTVKEAVGPKVPVIVGTGNYSTSESIHFTREAEALGMDGALVVCPYYNKPPQEGLFRHFKMIAEKTKLPIMIYNIPGRTGVNMLPETVERLSEIQNIVGIKEAAGSVEQTAEMARRIRAKTPVGTGARTDSKSISFSIWSGDDALTLPFLSVGAYGVVSVAGHLVAPRLKRMMEAFFEGKLEEAQAIHFELLPLFKALFVSTNPIPVKAALNLAGFNVGSVRPPLVEAGEKEIQVLLEAMRPLGLLASER